MKNQRLIRSFYKLPTDQKNRLLMERIKVNDVINEGFKVLEIIEKQFSPRLEIKRSNSFGCIGFNVKIFGEKESLNLFDKSKDDKDKLLQDYMNFEQKNHNLGVSMYDFALFDYYQILKKVEAMSDIEQKAFLYYVIRTQIFDTNLYPILDFIYQGNFSFSVEDHKVVIKTPCYQIQKPGNSNYELRNFFIKTIVEKLHKNKKSVREIHISLASSS